MPSNTFREINLENLEHVIHNHPKNGGYGQGYSPDKNTSVYLRFHDLLNHQFRKKYVLLYQNDSLRHGCDILDNRKVYTETLAKIVTKHPECHFLVVDHGVFDIFTLRQYKNCEIWPRKYFASFYSLTHSGARDLSVIERQRQHWFCSILGRNDIFRTRMFEWYIENSLEKSNKISYACYGMESRDLSKHDNQKELYVQSGGQEGTARLVPFNNFEETIPHDTTGRVKKAMPVYDCLFNVIFETFQTTGIPLLTEKSLNAVLYGHIPLVVGGPGSMKKLQDMGMIIPDYLQWPIWDELQADNAERNKISILQRQLIKLFNSHDIKEISKDWYPYAVRNMRRYIDLTNSCAMEEQEICRWILTATHNLSNRKYQYLWNK